MKLTYSLEECLPVKENLIYGLQWLAVATPILIIFGKLLGNMQGTIEAEILYVQKTFAVTAVSILLQVLWGHRLPLVLGPATVLLIGILASPTSSLAEIYSSIMICGLLLTLLAVSGLFEFLRQLFTPRVVAVILLLVAFTMMPTIMKLLISASSGISTSTQLGFTFVFIVLMFIGQRLLTGLWKSTLILWSMIVGSVAYFFLNPAWIEGANAVSLPAVGGFFNQLTTSIAINPGLITAFLLCYLGLAINDLGSIQAVGSILQVDEMPKRITRGITATGLGNALAGFMGVIGPVNFSFSPGIIASTGCAARCAFIPAGIAMLMLAFLPNVLFYLSFIPGVVIGCILLFVMCTQVAAGLTTAFAAMEQPYFDNALLIGLPILVGIIVAFLPTEVVLSFPVKLRPILANGFVMGVIMSLLLEHLIFRSAATKKTT